MKAKSAGQAPRLHVVGGARQQRGHSQREQSEAIGDAKTPATVEQFGEMRETQAQALSRLERLESAVIDVARNLEMKPRGKKRRWL